MRRFLLIALVALAGAPAVFADPPGASTRVARGATLTEALNTWCATRPTAVCADWQAEHTLDHQAFTDAFGARLVLRRQAKQLAIEGAERADGWVITRVRAVRTVRCGTPAFARLARALRRSAPAAWVDRIDRCQPDAKAPLEVERRALSPIALRGVIPPAALQQGPHRLALRWQDGAWRP